MKKLIILLLAPLMLACSKDNGDGLTPDGDPNVTIEYIVENGNSDGIVRARKYEKDSKEFRVEEIGKGSNFRKSDKVDNNFLYQLTYSTETEVKPSFKLIVKANGKVKETYYLSDVLVKLTYVNEGKVGNL